MKPFVVDLHPVRSEKVSAAEYLKLQAEHPTLIAKARFIPPQPGRPGFGEFFVSYTRARHKSLVHG